MDLSFREALTDTDTFVFCVELVTSRGIIIEKQGKKVLELARRLVEWDRIHALSITDNPGGNAMLSPDTLGTDLISRGQEIIIHLSCKDWNRNALQSRAWELASAGFQNVLALSGDYPTSGYRGQAAPVFDIDSVGLLEMLNDLNRGMEVQGLKPGSVERLNRTNFFLGTVVSPFKLQERELIPQYLKLARKVESGAAFVITQLGYDARKFDEALRYAALQGLNVPFIANVYVLNPAAARYFHRGDMPGCVVTPDLLGLVEKQAASPDRGKGFFLELAARQVAIARGLGYRGAYLGGHLAFEDYRKILETEASFGPDDWRTFAKEIAFSRPGEFYYFEPDPETGLNAPPGQPRLPGLQGGGGAAQDPVGPPGELQAQPPGPQRRLRQGRPRFPARPGGLSADREGRKEGQGHRPRRRAGGQGPGLRLPGLRGLRGLLPPRNRLPLPRISVRQEPAQRPLRRHPAGAVRGG
ncbi:MAG: hypothetical protein EXS64_19880 [Candidatus Latescibacteria bacterium]|nr:hypothetical protein [Candidatus Latescibacterota bacterium]